MNKPLDLTKPVQTRDGRKVRILCTDSKHGDGSRPVVALIDCSPNGETMVCYKHDGLRHESFPDTTDLINIPEKRVVWVNVYPSGDIAGVEFGKEQVSKAACDGQVGSNSRIACVRVEFTEGEGL